MIAIAVPGFACLFFGSLALMLMLRATFSANTPGRRFAFVAGAGAAAAVLIVSFRIFWSVIAQVNVNFGGGRPAEPRWWPILLVYALWAGVLVVRQVTNARREAMKKLRLSMLLMAIGGFAHASEPTIPGDFGPNTSVTVIGAHEFVTQDSSAVWGDLSFFKWTEDDIRGLVAPLQGIPEGALILEVNFYFLDDDGSREFEGTLCRAHTAVAGGMTEFDCPVQETYAGGADPGNAILTTQPNLTFRSYDPVGFGQPPELVSWHVGASSGSIDIGIRMVSVLWQRQVTPAPSIATFNDVPVSDPAFQFIEALADSNITAGCGSGNYCPDAPLTRRQMAVFLAKALGLHWAFGS